MRRPPINLTTAERLGRIVVGIVAVAGGAVLLTATGGFILAALEVLLIVAGLDLITTGALGYCPLYGKLGYLPPSLRTPA